VYDRSYLKKAGQLWKCYLGTAVVLLGAALIWIGTSRMDAPAATGIDIMLAGIVVGLAGMVWSALAVRCPKCGTRLVWRAVSEQSTANWLMWLLHLDSCPSCKAT
jgi:hypothetical protein